MSDNRITTEELQEMFGASMPWEAADLLHSGRLTPDEARVELRKIANRKEKPRYYECGICDQIHPWGWNGDCRDDANRFNPEDLEAIPGGYELMSWEERQTADQELLSSQGI